MRDSKSKREKRDSKAKREERDSKAKREKRDSKAKSVPAKRLERSRAPGARRVLLTALQRRARVCAIRKATAGNGDPACNIELDQHSLLCTVAPCRGFILERSRAPCARRVLLAARQRRARECAIRRTKSPPASEGTLNPKSDCTLGGQGWEARIGNGAEMPTMGKASWHLLETLNPKP